ncbi:hypothetical protein CEK29_16225 [Bordetella genomosp. 5]|nr:hypothetical protein CEK29_16225 [Bordetella genomosp. 5]
MFPPAFEPAPPGLELTTVVVVPPADPWPDSAAAEIEPTAPAVTTRGCQRCRKSRVPDIMPLFAAAVAVDAAEVSTALTAASTGTSLPGTAAPLPLAELADRRLAASSSILPLDFSS